jgi:thiol-disulfide isomerase/thioredoxin
MSRLLSPHPTSMEKSFRQRRQFLFYLGMGVAGSAALGSRWQQTPSTTAIAHSPLVALGEKPLPEFQGISAWLNSGPLAIANLKGSVTLVQFWTLGCINCQRTLPYVTGWHRQYAAQGLKVIGIHTPEFAYERDLNNIKKAIQQHQITYPVPVDNAYKTWNAYSNQYWPHLFLADRQGLIRYDHIGEGAYDTTEQTIRKLLG